MIHNQTCVNGILAAVLSASIIPLHGALAKEKSPRLQKVSARPAAAKMERHDAAPPSAATPAAPETTPPPAQ
jgi:hypothetical protein